MGLYALKGEAAAVARVVGSRVGVGSEPPEGGLLALLVSRLKPHHASTLRKHGVVLIADKKPDESMQTLLAFVSDASHLAVLRPEVAQRVAQAHRLGAADHWIADAKLDGHDLVVRSCMLEPLRVRIERISALRGVRFEYLKHFEIDESRLHWPALDVDLGLDGLRQIVDPHARKAADQKMAAHLSRLGVAIRALREQHGLKQDGIRGVSERTIRRLEAGQGEAGQRHPRASTLRALAKAHGMDTNAYLEALTRVHSIQGEPGS